MDNPTLKQKIGCWLHERWRTELALTLPSPLASRCKVDWKWLCNRKERLLAGEDGSVQCGWEGSSFLTVARFFPKVGGRLLRRCLHEWPIRFAQVPSADALSGNPRISVILPVGGRDRIPLLRCVLSAFFAQTAGRVEFIVVEHGEEPDFREECPRHVRYFFVPRTRGEQFNKSKAMNEGVRAARADLVLLHDGDVVPPVRLLESVLGIIDEGWEAVRPVRLLFHLGEPESQNYILGGKTDPVCINLVQANNPGLSTAVRKETYWRIGGHDERFEGWGGEDWEFLDRLRGVRLYPGGFAPAVHLWHAQSPKKADGDRNDLLVNELRSVSASERIRQLREKPFPQDLRA